VVRYLHVLSIPISIDINLFVLLSVSPPRIYPHAEDSTSMPLLMRGGKEIRRNTQQTRQMRLLYIACQRRGEPLPGDTSLAHITVHPGNFSSYINTVHVEEDESRLPRPRYTTRACQALPGFYM
jgi:hypothetical protein